LKQPLLSVVTINRNNALNLPRTLNSLEQLRCDPMVECLFIDGASTDESVAIASNFYAQQHLWSEPDRGIYHAMNKGLARANGKYVLWLNSGDEFRPGAGALIKEALASDDSDLLAFSIFVRDEATGEERLSELDERSLPTFCIHHQAALFKAETVRELGGYDEMFRVSADRELTLRMFFEGRNIAFRPTPLSVFYTGGAISPGFY
jgi:glycosyltransferase involved in cell wall biosynthesis